MVELELCGDLGGDAHQLGVVKCLEVHREACPHLLPSLRMAEQDPAAMRDPVDRPLRAAGELHHERLGPVVAEQLDELLQPERLGDARAVLQQLPAAICGRRDDAKAPRA